MWDNAKDEAVSIYLNPWQRAFASRFRPVGYAKGGKVSGWILF